MSVVLKICGIRRPDDVAFLNEFLPDYAGFICSEPFWRYVSPDTVRQLTAALSSSIRRVGVFVDPSADDIAPFAPYLDVIQLHGDENTEVISRLRSRFPDKQFWKAVRVRSAADIAAADRLDVEMLVLDSFSAQSHGGTGTVAPWDVIADNRPEKPFFLAGGIGMDNVQEAVRAVDPYGVDASSSLETDKCKSREKIARMVELVREL